MYDIQKYLFRIAFLCEFFFVLWQQLFCEQINIEYSCHRWSGSQTSGKDTYVLNERIIVTKTKLLNEMRFIDSYRKILARSNRIVAN